MPIAIIVGQKDSVTWHLPKSLLTYHSPFFAAALEGSFAEAQKMQVCLVEDDPESFRIFVQWMLAEQIDLDSSVIGMKSPDEEIAKAWVLGDKLRCPRFQNQLMLQLISLYQNQPICPITAATAYYRTAPNSKLRKFIIAKFLHDVVDGRNNKNRFKKGWEAMSQCEDFSRDLMKTLVLKKSERPGKAVNQTYLYLEDDLQG